ncbi:MAG: HlyD family efflux transporter periplasmic adaptor subunit [Deltaproteobacteria bacterium]|nr:HlyD family efflux transporter periplasmic adaptor subunit [Deltaproteobacteria bacterium]
MDIPREGHAEKLRRKRILYIIVGVGLLGAAWFAVANLEPAARSIEADSLWMEEVKRGEMLREVRGPGTLVPEEIRWIGALTDGRVERILIKPGAEVTEDSVILELSNPAVERASRDAELQLQSAEADYLDLKVRLDSEQLSQQASAAAVEADYREAVLEAEANEQLSSDGLISNIELRRSQIRAEQLANRHRIEQQRLEKTAESLEAQLGSQRARLRQAEALFDLRKREMAGLEVRATLSGVLQQVPVEEGQQVSPGTNLARVARPDLLKAELRIAETQAKDVQVGQVARIDTRNGVIDGQVQRIDPAAQDGTVTVDVTLTGDLPRGARPQLSVDGTVELERLEDVLYVGRPAYGQPFGKIGLFRISEDGGTAHRVQVELGRSSVSTFEIVNGLQVGDKVILSDTSAYDNEDTLRLR